MPASAGKCDFAPIRRVKATFPCGLEKYPSAIKRPVVEAGAKLLVGFDSEEFALKLKA